MIGDQYSTKIVKLESVEGCPIEPEASVKRTINLEPKMGQARSSMNKGTVLDGTLQTVESTVFYASSSLPENESMNEFGGTSGVVISYCIKASVLFSAIGGEFAIDLPFKYVQKRDGSNQSEQSLTLRSYSWFLFYLDPENMSKAEDHEDGISKVKQFNSQGSVGMESFADAEEE